MTPRLRIIAGPNGSGKSTLAQSLTDDYYVNLYTFINADIINAEITKHFKTPCPFSIDTNVLTDFVMSSTYLDVYKEPFLNGDIAIDNNDYITFKSNAVNSYTSAIISDFIKEQYMQRHLSFTFETVFSHPSKVDFIKQAKVEGYKTYMYFVATENPLINIDRIDYRVSQGGHYVPNDKVEARYHRCLQNIKLVLPYLDRAYFFDNTNNATILLAELNTNSELIVHSSPQANWFITHVLN